MHNKYHQADKFGELTWHNVLFLYGSNCMVGWLHLNDFILYFYQTDFFISITYNFFFLLFEPFYEFPNFMSFRVFLALKPFKGCLRFWQRLHVQASHQVPSNPASKFVSSCIPCIWKWLETCPPLKLGVWVNVPDVRSVAVRYAPINLGGCRTNNSGSSWCFQELITSLLRRAGAHSVEGSRRET